MSPIPAPRLAILPAPDPQPAGSVEVVPVVVDERARRKALRAIADLLGLPAGKQSR